MQHIKDKKPELDPSARPFSAWLCQQISEKQVAFGHHKWSLRKVATKAGITNQYLGQLMSAKRPWCTNEVATKIAKALGASVREAVARNMLQRSRCYEERALLAPSSKSRSQQLEARAS